MFNYKGLGGDAKHVTFLRGILGSSLPPYYTVESYFNVPHSQCWINVLMTYIRDGVTEIWVSGHSCGRYLKGMMEKHGVKTISISAVADMSRFEWMMKKALYYYPFLIKCQCSQFKGYPCVHERCPERRAIVTFLHMNKFLD